MDSGKSAYAVKYDLTNCESEPIHLIRFVQSHACLLACRLPDLQIQQISDNAGLFLGHSVDILLEHTLNNFFDSTTIGQIKEGLAAPDGFRGINPIKTTVYNAGQAHFYNIIGHVNPDNLLILEIEPIADNISTSKFQYILSNAIQNVQEASIDDLFEVTASEVKKITQYDRVMVYRFDQDYNGEVIAEAKEEHLEPYLNLRYPASDIPKQARELFLKNKVRLLKDVKSEPARVFPLVNPETKQPLDMTDTVARGLSPIHLEYLSNMGVGGSLSIAIILNEQLWGLIACHHTTSKYLDYSLRMTCQFIGQIFSGHLALQAANDYRESILESNITRTTLFEQMSSDYDILHGLTKEDISILDLVDCQGAAVITENQITLLGKTPKEEELRELANWLEDKTNTVVFTTVELPNIYPPSLAFKDTAAGLMAIKFTDEPSEYVLWFRPETVQEVYWGGNPKKAVVQKNEGTRISPRKSFVKWKELVKNTAIPWQKFERNTAIALRNDIKAFIIQKYKEIQKLNQQVLSAYKELESFSYSVSHDLRAPLRNIDGFAQILKEDYSNNLDEYGLEVLNTIIESANRMNKLITDILSYSKLGRANMIFDELDTCELIKSILKEFSYGKVKDQLNVKISGKLPSIYGDQILLRQLFFNIISNAIKYSEKEEKPVIEISGQSEAEQVIIVIKDNGIGFDMKYAEKIFGVFNRLVSEMEFEGTGIGLAIVNRIIEKHSGEIKVESTLGVGTTFFVKLPTKAFAVVKKETEKEL